MVADSVSEMEEEEAGETTEGRAQHLERLEAAAIAPGLKRARSQQRRLQPPELGRGAKRRNTNALFGGWKQQAQHQRQQPPPQLPAQPSWRQQAQQQQQGMVAEARTACTSISEHPAPW